MVHVFQAFPFEKSSEAIERIGWWSKVGIPLITQWKARMTRTAEEEEEEHLIIAPEKMI